MDNTAYDFERFAPKKQVDNVIKLPVAEQKPQVRHRLSFSTIVKKGVVALFVFACTIILINGYAVTNELTNSISAQERKLAEAQSTYVQLQNAHASKYTLNYVEDYAKNVLGMSKVSRAQIEYVKMNNKDKIEVLADNRSFFDMMVDTVKSVFS